MCGIAGEIGLGALPEPAHVSGITDLLGHRGPDDSGLWVSPGRQCVLGHARLSIIDLSHRAHQPMHDPNTGNCVVFNGEIYNFQALRAECIAAGETFASSSDTEVLLILYRRHGIACLQKLRGMFAFALWDERARRLILVRDRVGKKPLCYAQTDRGLVFASELAALTSHPVVSTGLDTSALELYLQLQYIPAPWSIYNGVRKLPPGHYAVFSESGLQVQSYWELTYGANGAHLSESDALDGLEERLTEAVRLRMIADVPLGALLSGGVDSSVVVALMARLAQEPIRTYSIGFREAGFNELPFAEQAARAAGSVHHAEIIGGDVAGLLPLVALRYGEPYGDSSAVPSFMVCRAAHEHVAVTLNGDGGDELMGGYPRYHISALQARAARLMGGWISPDRLSSLAGYCTSSRSLGSRVTRRLADVAWPELRSLMMYGGFWNDSERTELMNGSGSADLLKSWRAAWYTRAVEAASEPVNRMLWYDNHTYLPGDLLTKMDIASMHCGLETRSPLLDQEVIEYCAGLPSQYKVRNGVGKYLLKRLAQRFYPREFVHRRKMGFAIPVADWLRGPLRSILEETLRDPECMSPLDTGAITRTLDEFLSHDSRHASRLWVLLMFGMWRRTLQPGKR